MCAVCVLAHSLPGYAYFLPEGGAGLPLKRVESARLHLSLQLKRTKLNAFRYALEGEKGKIIRARPAAVTRCF